MAYITKTEDELLKMARNPLSVNTILGFLDKDEVAYRDLYIDLNTATLFVLGMTEEIEASEEFELMLYKAGFSMIVYHWPDGFYVKRHLDDVRFPNGELDKEFRLIKNTKENREGC